MPIKAKPIDPERARLAARGQLNNNSNNNNSQEQQKVLNRDCTRHSLESNTLNNNNRSYSSGSCTSSSGESNTSREKGKSRKIIKKGVYLNSKKIKNSNSNGSNKNDITSQAFLTSTTIVENNSFSSDSDPELYRVARERTQRFLYPNGRCTKSNMNSDMNTISNLIKKETFNEFKIDNLELGAKTHLTFSIEKREQKQQINNNNNSTEIDDEEEEKRFETNNYRNRNNNNSSDDDDDDKNSSPINIIPPPVVQEALRESEEIEYDESKRDFARLLELFADDMEQERKQKSEIEINKKLESSYVKEKKEETKKKVQISKTYVRPPRTFSELQERALLQLYAAREEEEEENDNEKEENSESYFIATDHMAEAFTLAALEAEKDRFSINEQNIDDKNTKFSSELNNNNNNNNNNISINRPFGAPLSLMEIVAAERTRRNAKAAFQQRKQEEEQENNNNNNIKGKGLISSNQNTDELLSADAEVIAANAEASLNRFLSSVRCIETAVRDQRVINELGRFLFQYHKPFLQASNNQKNNNNNNNNFEDKNDSIKEYPHEAFTIYERYSRYLSTFLTGLLKRRVPNFSVEEFALALYDVNDDSNENTNENEINSIRSTTMDVLSYPAWRLLQSIASFNQFCEFMNDFIAEEYGVEKISINNETNSSSSVINNNNNNNIVKEKGLDDDVVVAAGARGIRALLAKTNLREDRQWLMFSYDDKIKKKDISITTHQAIISPSPPPTIGEKDIDIDVKSSLLSQLLLSSSSSLELQQQQQQEAKQEFNNRKDETQNRAESAPVLGEKKSISNITPFAPHSLSNKITNKLLNTNLHIIQTPTPPIPLTSSQRSSYSSVSSISQIQKVHRRPEFIPGRNLPPISLSESGKSELMFAPAPPKLYQSSGTTTSSSSTINVGLNTIPITKIKKEKGNTNTNKGVKSTNSRTPSSSTGGFHTNSISNKDKNMNSDVIRSRSGTRKKI